VCIDLKWDLKDKKKWKVIVIIIRTAIVSATMKIIESEE